MFGKLHLLLLHFPIGLLIAGFGLEISGRLRRRSDWQAAAFLALRLGTVTAVLSAFCGWMLARSGAYEIQNLQGHQWTGIATCAAAIGTWLLWHSKWMLPAFGATVALLSVAGHLGGNITHGEHYLFEPVPEMALNATPAFTPESNAFQAIVQPILQKKCVSCHNAAKTKGGFRMDTPELLLKGGKTGKAIVAGNPASSLLIQRLLLPLQHEEHMPPSGKAQVSNDELKLLQWWIQEGAAFDKNIKELSIGKEVEHLLSGSGKATAESPVFQISQKPAAPAAIAALKNAGAAVSPLFQGSPWLVVSWAGNKSLNPEKIALLKDIRTQVLHLDCSNTNLDDVLWAKVPELPHLIRLQLAQTQISDASTGGLAHSTYLQLLNLCGTQVSDAGLANLATLQHLNTLYVWNSRVSTAGLAQLKAQKPGLRAVADIVPDTSSTPIALRPPKLQYGRHIFEDTLHLSFDFPKMVEIYYTLDGASPTTQSLRYQGEELILDQAAKVRAIAYRKGWQTSKEATQQFLKKKYAFLQVELAKASDPKFEVVNGPMGLGDGRVADHTADKTYLAYQGDDLVATIDLGIAQSIEKISAHAYEATGAWVFYPKRMRVSYSNDRRNWKPFATASYPISTAEATHAQWFDVQGKQAVQARYLKVEVFNIGPLPQWHPSKGQKAWVFIDEVLVQ